MSERNQRALDVFAVLDVHGRDYDTMGGNPLPLRIEAVNAECGKYGDTEGLRWRVLLLDRIITDSRRKKAQKQGGKK